MSRRVLPAAHRGSAHHLRSMIARDVNTEQAGFAWKGRPLSGIWEYVESAETFLVLAHGAGGTLRTPGLARFSAMLAAQGVGVVRFNFPYAEAGRRAPDPRPVLEAAYRAVAETVRVRAGRLLLGGRSMGGRIASHLAAGGFSAAGLVFLAYPLHPPGKPAQLRDRHLPEIEAPMLFLQGSRDPFARLDLLERTSARLPGATLHIVEGAGHDLTVPGRGADVVASELARVTRAWVAALPSP